MPVECDRRKAQSFAIGISDRFLLPVTGVNCAMFVTIRLVQGLLSSRVCEHGRMPPDPIDTSLVAPIVFLVRNEQPSAEHVRVTSAVETKQLLRPNSHPVSTLTRSAIIYQASVLNPSFSPLLTFLSGMKLLLDNVSKRYGRREVVKQVTMQVEPGEIVGLLGPNGAGKTTTFYMATGLERPTRGQVWLGETDITEVPIHRRANIGIGYLAQEASIFRRLSIQDNLLLVMEQTGVPRKEWADRLDKMLAEFRISHVAQSLGIQVSGGERRRAEIARALVAGKVGPKFLLLDEPFAGVDPIAVNDIQEAIAQLKQRGIGVLVTDHNVRETLAITDRAYIMNDGNIIAKGNSQQLAVDPLVRKYYLGENFRL